MITEGGGLKIHVGPVKLADLTVDDFPLLPEGYSWRLTVEHDCGYIHGVSIAITRRWRLFSVRSKTWTLDADKYADDPGALRGRLIAAAEELYQDFVNPPKSPYQAIGEVVKKVEADLNSGRIS